MYYHNIIDLDVGPMSPTKTTIRQNTIRDLKIALKRTRAQQVELVAEMARLTAALDRALTAD